MLIRCFILLAAWTLFFSGINKDLWGFYGHRKINRMAIFTLPQDLIPIYKKNIEYITEHAVDPDKRRYSTKREAPRHYIDLDHWGTAPFNKLPRSFIPALVDYAEVNIEYSDGKKENIFGHNIAYNGESDLMVDSFKISKQDYRLKIQTIIAEAYFEDEWELGCSEFSDLFDIELTNCNRIIIVDSLSMYGIVPYHLWTMQKRLQNAFESLNTNQVLRLSAEMGHYISDAHVPLHTTENYNGQLTGQDGIHAFWESRIPELFADSQFDFFVGPASYIKDPKSYFWEIVLESHSYVDSVLSIERRLRNTFSSDQQYCYEERLDRTVRTQCKAFADAYNREMKGMVEKRMRDAITAVGNIWYTAWVDAGQPDISSFGDFELTPEQLEEQKREDEQYRQGTNLGRAHENKPK